MKHPTKKTSASGQSQFDFESVTTAPKTAKGEIVLTRPLVFFDLETTGLDPQNDRIIQFAFVRVMPDHTTQEWLELVNPATPIPPEAVQIHHITDEMVADKPGFDHFAPRIREFLLDCDLAGFNVIRFDLPFLQAEMGRHDSSLDLSRIKVVDVQVIYHKKEPRDLTAAYRFYCNRELVDAHDALADVHATLQVFYGQLKKYPDLPQNPAGLAEFSGSDDSDRWVTNDRKFYWRHNQAVLSFGKNRGKSLQWLFENDPDYLRWMNEKDFPEQTRNVIRAAMKGIFPQKTPKTE